MVVGSLVHELLQIVLQKQLKTMEEIYAECDVLLKSDDVAYIIYENCLERTNITNEMHTFVPHIYNFVQEYIVASRTPAANNFQGRILEIKDIEENLWVPQLGLKGKIDVSVRVHRNRKSKTVAVMPLEMKTGRATFSMEHKGQVLLYQMMLTAMGCETDAGLLLYLREGIMRESCGQRNEQRDLIILRNELAHYLVQRPVSEKQPFQLPEPISRYEYQFV